MRVRSCSERSGTALFFVGVGGRDLSNLSNIYFHYMG